jgi:hypothetical protein
VKDEDDSNGPAADILGRTGFMNEVSQLVEFIDWRRFEDLSSDIRQQIKLTHFAGKHVRRMPSFPRSSVGIALGSEEEGT